MPSKKTAKTTPKTSDKVNIRPLGDRVLLRPLTDDDAEKTASGILLPETIDKERPEQGIVLAVGEGKYNEDGDERIPMMVKKGDRVLFAKYGPEEITVNDEEYLIVSESSILAIIE